VPIIWKCRCCGWATDFLFVDRDFSDDVRVKFIIEQGASLVNSKPINFYHEKIRPILPRHLIRPATDRLIAYIFGVYFLQSKKVQAVANEWSGGSGRARASYFLYAARIVGIPTFALPHGYFIWKNALFNKQIAGLYRKTKKLPDFTDRNRYTRYVVHSKEQYSQAVRYGIKEEKLVILGSARFCREWTEMNWALQLDQTKQETRSKFVVLFFLPHWDYNVDRAKCLSLIELISRLKNVCVRIKAHTRGTGALTNDEVSRLCKSGTVGLAKDSEHSTVLVGNADLIINFGSSVGFEALQQNKPVINPRFLHSNETFFDDCGIVIDTYDAQETLAAISKIQLSSGEWIVDPSLKDRFLDERIEDPNGSGFGSVLSTYLWLLAGRSVLDGAIQKEN